MSLSDIPLKLAPAIHKIQALIKISTHSSGIIIIILIAQKPSQVKITYRWDEYWINVIRGLIS